MRDASTVDYSDLQVVKLHAHELAELADEPMTVILRPGHTMYNIIFTSAEGRVKRDALVVYRTNGQ